MCSLTLSEAFSNQLAGLDGRNSRLIRTNMVDYAHRADVEHPGTLDAPMNNLRTGFAEELRVAGVRYQRIGRHRIFYTGAHADCNYTAFFVKLFKRKDDKSVDDNNPVFHELLETALATPSVHRIADPREPEPQEETPDWQNTDWFKNQQKYLPE